jgi:hypothetical protein
MITGSAIEMYVPMVGTNWATMPVHRASGIQYGIPMITKTTAVVAGLMPASTTRAPT